MKELERQAETLGLDTRKGNREPQKGPSGRALSQVAILSFRKVELLRQDQRQEGQENAGWQSSRKTMTLILGQHGSEK